MDQQTRRIGQHEQESSREEVLTLHVDIIVPVLKMNVNTMILIKRTVNYHY